jgi:membrane protein YqaA with SNARE-associated domain
LFRHLTETLIAWGPLGILILSVLDSSGIPVAGVFDALLIVIAVERPSVAWLCAGLAVIGSTVGNTVLFYAARRGGRRFMHESVPDSRASKFQDWFRRYGLVTVFVPALVPIPMPLKLFVISAGVLGTTRTEFISVILIARFLRYFGEAWLGVRLGQGSSAFLKSHAWSLVVGAVLIFVTLYLFILIRDRKRSQANL